MTDNIHTTNGQISTSLPDHLTMTSLLLSNEPLSKCLANSNYYDKKSGLSKSEYSRVLNETKCVYVGNLRFGTTEDELYFLFITSGFMIDSIVMGLNKLTRKPCGFAFVFLKDHSDALSAKEVLNGTIFQDRVIRVDLDIAPSADAVEGTDRNYGRGETGNQWRDDFRKEFDRDRGGKGGYLLREIEEGSEKKVFIGGRKDGKNISSGVSLKPNNLKKVRKY